MAKRIVPVDPAPDLEPGEPVDATPEETPTRVDQLVHLLDHCTAAKDTADSIGEKFLSYLLSMAIQESRSAMRQTAVSK